MDERINRVAALANASVYDGEATRTYTDGAPHIKHAALRQLYGKLVVQVFDKARQYVNTPLVLDLGAGEGSATLAFLELGARVVAVDISNSQLNRLKSRCSHFSNMLEVHCEDINTTLLDKSRTYDIVVANSILHHIPDYLWLVKESTDVLNHHGHFFSFQDPLRYDTVGRATMMFSTLAYSSWRISRGDIIGGMRRRLRRSRGVYLEDLTEDNAEYHITRNGVDQDAICRLLKELGLDCAVIPYFSTQSRFFQVMGTSLGVENTFAVVGRKQV